MTNQHEKGLKSAVGSKFIDVRTIFYVCVTCDVCKGTDQQSLSMRNLLCIGRTEHMAMVTSSNKRADTEVYT
jgi:predicted nucleic-acid-binding Zn-ribbon protein